MTIDERIELIMSLTDSQLRSMLADLAGSAGDKFDAAAKHATR